MITNTDIQEAKNFILREWKNDGKKVLAECAKIKPFNGNVKSFLNHCTACCGNWGGMLLTGINTLYPNVWDAIPDQMGAFAFSCIAYVLTLCGVDTSEEAE